MGEEQKTPNASKLVASSMLGLDGEVVVVGGKAYYIFPPTIKKILGMGYYMSDFGNENSIGEFFSKLEDMDKPCKALSWLVKGDESITEDLKEGTLQEVCDALEKGVSLCGVGNFYRLSLLGKSVQKLIAKQR